MGFFFDPIENENLVQRGLYLQRKVQQTAAWRGVPGAAVCCRLCQQQCHFLALNSSSTYLGPKSRRELTQAKVSAELPSSGFKTL